MASNDQHYLTTEQARRLKTMLDWFETSGLAEGGSTVNRRPKSISTFSPGDFRKVKVYAATGSAGTATTPCSFAYEVRAFDGTVLFQSDFNHIAPSWPRTLVGKYIAHTDGQICIGCLEYTKEGPEFRLVSPPEAPAVRTCT